MWPQAVILVEPSLETVAHRIERRVVTQVDLFVFQAPPQPLDKHVVHPATFAAYADLYSQRQQAARPGARVAQVDLV